MSSIIQADSYQWIKECPDKSIDHIITDYVYGMTFPFDDCLRVCNGNIITFCASEDEPFIPTERAYWIKTPSTKNYSKHLGRFVEKIYIYRQGDAFNCLHWSQMTGVYNDLVIESDGHQWRKPLTLLERLVRIYTNLGDLILDPFMGSGTTLVACKNLSRRFIGIDIDPYWVEFSSKRLESNVQTS
jgi:DNA modification methylase